MPREQTTGIRDRISVRWTVWSYLPFLLLALATSGLIAGAARVLWPVPYDGMRWSAQTGHVSHVDPHGPATRAGIRPGDRVLALDGVPLAYVYPVYHDRRAGNQVVFTLERAGRAVTVSLTLTAPSLREYLIRLEPLLVALAFWGVGLVVWALCPFHGVSRLFFLLSQAMAGMLAVGGLSAFRIPWAVRLFNLLLLLVAALALHFYASFPDPLPTRYRRSFLRLAYGVTGSLALAYLLWTRPPAEPAAPPWLWAGIRSFTLLTLLAALALLSRRRKGPLLVRQRRRLLIAGMVSSLLPLLLLSFLPELVWGLPKLDYVWTFPFLILLPLSYGYAVRQGELGRVDLILNRSLVYLTLTLLLAALYLLLSALLGYLGVALGGRLPPPHPLPGTLVMALVAGVAAVTFYPLRDRLQRQVDRLFYGGWYDYRSVVSEMSQALGGIVGARELADLLVERLASTLRLRGAALLLLTDDETLAPVRSTGSSFDGIPTLPLPPSGALARALCRAARPLTPPELQAALAETPLTDAERAWLSHPGLALWVPLVRQGELQGLLLLGPRVGEEPFDPQDRHLLTTLAWNAAVAAENARLFKALRRRAEEIDRLYTQLAQSREEERKHLARELHDQVIQDLINVYHYLGVNGPRLAPTPQEHAQALQARVQTLVERLRQVCTELRPAALDELDLGLAMDGYVEEVAEEWGLPITLRLPPNRHAVLAPLPEDIRVCLFRTLQEALTNVHRHAQATQVEVALEVLMVGGRPSAVVLTVRDDGRGFQCPARLGALIHEGHFGLAGLQERLNLIGGTLEVTSAPGRGTTLRARVPWDGSTDTERDNPEWANSHPAAPPSSPEFLRAP